MRTFQGCIGWSWRVLNEGVCSLIIKHYPKYHEGGVIVLSNVWDGNMNVTIIVGLFLCTFSQLDPSLSQVRPIGWKPRRERNSIMMSGDSRDNDWINHPSVVARHEKMIGTRYIFNHPTICLPRNLYIISGKSQVNTYHSS